MIYRLFLSLNILLHLCVSNAEAQTAKGVLLDSETQVPVQFASVTFSNSQLGVVTDKDGRFDFPIIMKGERLQIFFTARGYLPDSTTVSDEKVEYCFMIKRIPYTLNEITITGVSRATYIRENPVAVDLVSNEAIQRSSENNIIDVLVKNVPGLNAVKTGPNVSKPFIRGLGYNRVLTLYDGVRQEGQQWGDEHGIEVDPYNIERAEVIKGPASLMYGSDALAGIVSLIPAMPTFDNSGFSGKYFSEYHHNNGLIGNGVRLNSTHKNWAYALRGSMRIAKNYQNAIDGRVYNTGFRETNVSSSANHRFKRGTANFNFTLYDNFQGIPDGSRDSASRKFTKQIYEAGLDDVTARPIVSDRELNSYKLSPLIQHIRHYRIYGTSKFDIGKSNLHVNLAFQKNIRKEYNHPTEPLQAGMHVRLNTLNYGLRYDHSSFSDLEWSAGINGMYQHNRSKEATDFPIPDYQLFDMGGFIYAKWKHEDLVISGGARYDTRTLSGNDFFTKVNPSNGFGSIAVPPDTVGAYLQFAGFDKTFRGVSVSIGATYKVNEHISLKANLARGYRAPNITEFASNGLDPGARIIYLGNRNFGPEFSFQQDVGIDIRYPGLKVSASLFNNEIQNYIYLSLLTDGNGNPVLDAQRNRTYQYQQSKATIRGAEFSMNIHPQKLKGFSVDNNISVIYGVNKKSEFKNAGIFGEYLPLIPPFRWLSAISHSLFPTTDIIEELTFRFESEFNGSQNRYLALDNSETATSGYSVYNLSVAVNLQYHRLKKVSVSFQINNLFDKTYQSHLSRLKYFEYFATSGGNTGIFNMGRNACIKTIIEL